jgi:hypothetical protein
MTAPHRAPLATPEEDSASPRRSLILAQMMSRSSCVENARETRGLLRSDVRFGARFLLPL